MGNMSYCRFENTLSDLEDCYETLCELMDGETNLSDSELRKAKQMMDVCRDIVEEFGDEDLDELNE